jgi:hypothetical protein
MKSTTCAQEGSRILSNIKCRLRLAWLLIEFQHQRLNQEHTMLIDYTHETELKSRSRSALNKNIHSWTMAVSGTLEGTELHTMLSWELTSDFGPITQCL